MRASPCRSALRPNRARGAPLRPRQTATLHIERRDGRRESVALVLRIDTPIEAAYFSAGGILPYVLGQLLAKAERAGSPEQEPTP